MSEREPQGPSNDPGWRTRFGLGPTRPDGLKGDTEPNDRVPPSPAAKAFVGEVPAQEHDEHYNWFCDQLIDWPWLRVERHFGFHYGEPEIAIEIRLPWYIRYGSNSAWRPKAWRSYVIAFGRVHTRLVKASWHVRGGPSYWSSYFL